MQTIELQVITLKNGKFQYSAVLDGKVIATRTSNRVYVAALVGAGLMDSYIGRADLIDGAVRKNPDAQYLAVITNTGAAGGIPPAGGIHRAGTVVEVTDRFSGHPFEIGQTVSLCRYLGSGKCYFAEDDRGLTGFVHVSEFKILTPAREDLGGLIKYENKGA